jgi:hypothetical protein
MSRITAVAVRPGRVAVAVVHCLMSRWFKKIISGVGHPGDWGRAGRVVCNPFNNRPRVANVGRTG